MSDELFNRDQAQPASETVTLEMLIERNPLRDLKELNIEAAAATLMSWTDKNRAQAANNIRKKYGHEEQPILTRSFEQATPAAQALYKHLVVALLRNLAGEVA